MYCTFNILRFGSTMDSLFPHSQPYNDETLARARELVRGMAADLGGTEILKPLQHILGEKEVEAGRAKRLFILTDGAVSNSMECVRKVERERGHWRMFTLGIGASADRHLVKGLARAGRGTSVFTGEDAPSSLRLFFSVCLWPLGSSRE